MQNLPVTGAPSAAPQTPTQPDGGADRPAEPFGSVLARQRASQESADKGEIAVSPAGGTSAANGSGDNPGNRLTHLPGAAAGLLAALLPADDSLSSRAAASETADFPERATDGGGALAGGMLAALQAATPARPGAMPFKPEAAGGSSGTRYAAPPHFRAQDNSGTTFADSLPGAIRDVAFPPMPGMPGKDAAAPGLFHADSNGQVSAQAALPDGAVTATLPQTGTAPNAAVGPGGAAQYRLGTPLANPAWGEEFGQRITWMATQREHTAELHLNPPNLGPLDVVLSVSGDQATAMFTSPHAAVRSAVEQALPKLREMLADNGIMLGNATVGDQPPGERHAGPGGQQKVWLGADAVPAGGNQPGLAAWHGRRQEGMVDTFV